MSILTLFPLDRFNKTTFHCVKNADTQMNFKKEIFSYEYLFHNIVKHTFVKIKLILRIRTIISRLSVLSLCNILTRHLKQLACILTSIFILIHS